MRLKWSHRRKWKVFRNIYLSINSGKTFYVTSVYDKKRKAGRWIRGKFLTTYWWRLWTLHTPTGTSGPYHTLAEAQYEAQIYHEMETC